mmetsp:Transcript_33437/g.58592  ORF Transcript_33437/g.58592 Transcript_33437/m.58592 type:complete len:699 (-) Transcript_33437:543-2639(-)
MSSTVTQGNTTSINEAKEVALNSRLDRMQGTQTVTVDPLGYITELGALKTLTEEEVSDLKKSKGMLASLLKSNPQHSSAWLTAARLEEKDGQIAKARELLSEGCKNCPEAVDLWIEQARLQPGLAGKNLLTQAALANPNSVKVWMALASRSEDTTAKMKVLRSGLEVNPTAVKLWKELLALADPDEARKLLRQAVKCVPHNLELWLALAKLESYKKARSILNEARQRLPYEPLVWIYAAKLEEAEGKEEQVDIIIQRAMKALTKSGVQISRQDMLKEARLAEQSGSLKTCESIVKHTLMLNLTTPEQEHTWIQDLELARIESCPQTARYLAAFALEALPQSTLLWSAAIAVEEQFGTPESLASALDKACLNSSSEGYWIQAAQLQEKLGNIEGARERLTNAASLYPVNPEIYKASAILECKQGNYKAAEEYLRRGLNAKDSTELWVLSSKLLIQGEQYVEAEALLNEAIHKHGLTAKFYCLLGDCLLLQQQIEPARKAFEKGRKMCPGDKCLWTHAASLEESVGDVIRSRYLLEQGRNKCSHPQVWIHSIQFEMRQTNTKAAELLLAKALQTHSQNGPLLALSVDLASKKDKKTMLAIGFERNPEAPELFLSAAAVFWSEGKLEKARSWFEKLVLTFPDFGDGWLKYYSFLRATDPASTDDLLTRVDSVEVTRGERWKRSRKAASYSSNSAIIRLSHA